ncbi:hypothetical protein [uncultured Winogradskyella sp.]|uniref:hypothetical protein n=1 Tax=Winogradskyella sp. 4-2091 TaxID=3381659 RepID=UPI002618ACD0|nr:hypothetical protein [uncultured Winogradskyella sp.]
MIKPNAVANEKDSPYYVKNESFCLKFESFISQLNGKSKGNYNAWSYSVLGEIKTSRKWILEYKKSTFSSGNLILSAKSQNLFVSAIWKTEYTSQNIPDFIIKKRTIKDMVSQLLRKNFSEIKSTSNYILVSDSKSKIIDKLIEILHPLFDLNEIYKISKLKNVLTIELRTDQHYFNIFNQINNLNF